MRIPISTKLISLTVTILIVATFFFAKQSSEFFEKSFTQREEYSNMSTAASKAIEIETLLNNELERLQIVGTLLMKASAEARLGIKSENTTTVIAASSTTRVQDLDELTFNFNKDKFLVSMDVIKVLPNGSLQVLGRKVKEDFYKQNKLTSDYVTQLRAQQKFPVLSVVQKNIEIKNATLPKGPPLITIGIPLTRDENDMVTHLALADLQMGMIQKLFSEQSERVLYLIDKSGELLAHQDEAKALAKLNFRKSPLVERALSSQTPRFQTQFDDPEDDRTYIGAYVKSPSFGITVVSQTAKEIILEPAQEVKRKAIYTAGVVISFALFFIFMFSMTLTSPIEKLAELIQIVSKGNFDVKARLHVKSHDEVGDLAAAFDNMTEGLKERDKVKNLFSKFHGSSVAEDLIKNDIGVGGQKKDVTVFFSDIRGFTKFSEGHTPEEVVTMLNEYFAIMVKIINKNGGVVDKFIGDAIMAIWGAPHTSDRDSHNAVKASIEMRIALAELNAVRAGRGQTDIMIGMGLHCGPAISGTIGSDERMEYTVIGDTVNTTSRIEASTKAFGTDLLISGELGERVKDEFKIERAGAVEVKGKSEPLTLWKVRGYLDKSTGQWIDVQTKFSDYEAEAADKVKMAG